MGLLDQVIGSVTGSKSSSGGTSPLTKALLLLLAAKAASSYFGKSDDKTGSAAPAGGATPPAAPSGRIESGILAGLPSLDSLFDRFKSSGHEDKVKSWIEPGPNREIAPQDLEKTLGPDAIAQLQKESGLPRDELMRQLSEALPKVVDKLTPDGRLPTESERARW
ncbi:YidB family protein [uncultured Enterovirga sp.]|uniref:YidB family protein n=1 Tax=uncultured Enterovirga sp. TaxID=2026352 RepID=UPI0035CABE9B